MQHDHNGDDSSHYEISLTAGQAFIAFVLLLLSLAASFAFGVIVGKGQFEGSLVAAAASQSQHPGPPPRVVEDQTEFVGNRRELTSVPAPRIVEKTLSEVSPEPHRPPAQTSAVSEPQPHFAQLLSTSDSKAAEALAARLIDGGFMTAYVERGNTARGLVHRVRVAFASESEARMNLEKLKVYASGEIWIAPAP